MVKDNLYVITSIDEYLNLINEITEKEEVIWLRGQSNASHKLIPSGLRNIIPIQDQFGRKIENGEFSRSGGDIVDGINLDRLFIKYKKEAKEFIKEDLMPKNDYEWLFLMQHYGAPTRLLDWSKDSLVALYFAMPEYFNVDNESDYHESIEDEFLENGSSDKGAAVFIINPNKINEKSTWVKTNGEYDSVKSPIDLSDEQKVNKWKYYLAPMKNAATYSPICVCPPQIDQRIKNQSGVFTLHGSCIWALDYYDVFRPLIYKIFIPYRYVLEMKAELWRREITASFIYPGLDGIGKKLKEEEEYKFYRKYNK